VTANEVLEILKADDFTLCGHVMSACLGAEGRRVEELRAGLQAAARVELVGEIWHVFFVIDEVPYVARLDISEGLKLVVMFKEVK